jgi:hypothetical protein
MDNLASILVFASITIVFITLGCWIYGRIAIKAGLSPWWALLMFIPLVNLIMIWVLAYANWPAVEERTYKRRSTRTFVAVISLASMVIFGLISMTFVVESSSKEIPLEIRKKVEFDLSKDPTFPARPVWWDKGHILGVGVLPNGQNRNSDAERVCQLLTRYDIKPAEVHVFDVLQIQNDDEWIQIGGAVCK